MKRLLVLVVLLASMACATSKENSMLDPKKTALVKVVLRIRFIHAEGGDKYAWDTVALVKVLKNDSGYDFPAQFQVAHYSAETGVPEGESTIYLEPYSNASPPLWKLLNGTGKDGVSHPSK